MFNNVEEKIAVFDEIENVNNREAFIAFLENLADDYKENNEEWVNDSISDYLESIAAWIKDWGDSHGNDEFEQLDFKELAKIFYVGKIYE